MTDGAVLVLNRLYQAVQITSIRRAFLLFYSGRARAVDRDFATHPFDTWSRIPARRVDRRIGTSRGAIRVPDVIQLLRYEKLGQREVRFNRRNLLVRDRYRCQYCARSMPRSRLNIDHVLPRSRGGPSRWENVVCACIECNSRKGDRTPDEAGMKLLKKPRRPVAHPLMRAGWLGPLRIEWRAFLDEAYWNVELEDALMSSADGRGRIDAPIAVRVSNRK